MNTRHMNKQSGTVLLTTLIALAYALPALADMPTAVVEETQSRSKKGEWGKECAVKVQHPTDAADPLAKAVNAYINEALGGSYQGDLFDAKAMVSHYIAECLKKPDEDDGDIPADMPPGEEKTEIGKLAETDAYITYEVSAYLFLGGAHGDNLYDGATFRKSDGRRMGWDAFVKTDEAGFKNLIKKGLKEYWEVKTDAELAENLMLENDGGVDAIPLPRAAPLFTKEGVRLTYASYEIAPYAAGMPQFVVPYAELEPYLTPEAREMVKP